MRVSCLLVLALLSGACSHIGPATVERDRFDYNAAIANSWKEQTLLNIVKLRYADMPLFVEVASVVAGYTLEGSVSVAGTLAEGNSIPDLLSLGATGKYTDRPTITYAPITGQQFNKSFMTPIPPRAVLFLIQSGWPADLILPLTVDAVNGLRARIAAGASQREGSDEFYRAVALIRQIQKSGAVGMHLVKDKDQTESTVMFFSKENSSPEVDAVLKDLAGLLGLRAGAKEFRVSYGLVPKSDLEVTLLTRSMLQIMVALAAEVDVPQRDVDEGRTVQSLPAKDARRQMRVHQGSSRPDHAFSAVKYGRSWFWIDDRDFASKRTFGFLMILFSLMETGGREGLPLVTIPAG